MTDHPVKVGTKVRCKNPIWPKEPGVVVGLREQFAAVRYGDSAHSLTTLVEDLVPAE